jgi:hypothetical protein
MADAIKQIMADLNEMGVPLTRCESVSRRIISVLDCVAHGHAQREYTGTTSEQILALWRREYYIKPTNKPGQVIFERCTEG